MNVVVVGAGLIGVCTAWYLRQLGHEVTVVERQPSAALETSFANAGQISVSYCEPWAGPGVLPKILKWLGRDDAPLLFRPQWDWQQWRWALLFLRQCGASAFERNVRQLVALGAYSHQALNDLVDSTGIEYQRLQRGIAHYFTNQASFDAAARAAEFMQGLGIARRVLSRAELLAVEPAFSGFGEHIVGGTYTASDESGNAQLFAQALAQHCAAAGVQFLFQHTVQQIDTRAGALVGLQLLSHQRAGEQTSLQASERLGARVGTSTLRPDAVVVACGSYSAPLLRRVGVDLPIYPGKGYSATFALKAPERAPVVSTIDDEVKCAFTRLGDQLRVAGTIEWAGFDLSLDNPIAQARCRMLAERTERVLPGVCDTRALSEGGQPRYWCGLRPATPSNVPYIGRTRIAGVWVNAGHGTLGWTHAAGSGKALAELLSGLKPPLAFAFRGG